jgi:large subunit ribosomal protein L4
MTLEVLNTAGEKTGRTVDLPEDIFGVEPNDHVIYLAVKQYLAARRHGNHKVKTRAEVKGASRKLHKQKGTGGSRKGNIRNPLYKGGGTIFGPKPHGYALKVNRKTKDLAKIGALAYKAKDNAIVIIEDINMDAPKTSQFAGVMKSLGVNNKKTLFVYPDFNNNLYLSLRNIPNADGTILSDVHTYEIMNADIMVLTESAARIFSEAEAEVAE